MDFKIKLFYTFAALLRIGKNCYVVLRIAQVAELVDALDSKSSFFGSAGSIPALSTKWDKFSFLIYPILFLYYI